ncbi:serine hydrolase domain-containing protein [Metabacillus indicus]|uniref:serine hydrolase domain-containing protein n=1 Tax=Metabacillus indicus TaxID=246786 RepID=UPI003CF9BA7D
MKNLRIFLVLTMMLLLFPSAVIAQERDQRKQIQQFIEESLKEYQIPGASLAIIQEGNVIFHGNWGVQSDGKRIKNNTLFTIGSISKPLTSLAIMKLVQERKINLDASIDTYLSSFKYDKGNFKNEITVRQLLSHTSGISSYDGLKVADLKLRGKESIEKAAKMLNGVKLNIEPGKIHQYSAANYLLLGRIIEEVSGNSFAQYMENEIFTEIGMNNTVSDYKKAHKLGYNPGYQAWFGTPVKSDNNFDDSGAPYGYIASTSSDMIKFIEFILGKQKVLDHEYFMEYTSPQVHRKAEFYYGLGWRISADENDSYLFHGGETPDSRSELFIHPKKQYGFILLTNKNNVSEVMHTTYIKEGIRDIIEENIAPKTISVDYKLQWLTLISIFVVLFLSLLFVFNLKKQKIISLRNKIIGTLYFVVGISIIPTLVFVFDSPWRTIYLYGSDIAMLTYCLIAICIVVSFIPIIQNYKVRIINKKRKSA